MRRKKRLSAWGILARLGHTGDDQDEIVEHVFEATARLTLQGDDGEPLNGDDYLVGVFESLGTTETWPSCGSPEWERLRSQALSQVITRLGCEGLYDCISVGAKGTPAPTGRPTADRQDGSDTTETPDAGGEGKSPTAEDEVPASDDDDGAKAVGDDNHDPRVGVQAYRAMIRRGIRNPTGWFRMVNRATPYRVIAGWASETCPNVTSMTALNGLKILRGVDRWVS